MSNNNALFDPNVLTLIKKFNKFDNPISGFKIACGGGHLDMMLMFMANNFVQFGSEIPQPIELYYGIVDACKYKQQKCITVLINKHNKTKKSYNYNQNHNSNFWANAMSGACESGDEELVDMISYHSNFSRSWRFWRHSLSMGAIGAAKGGQMKIFKKMIDLIEKNSVWEFNYISERCLQLSCQNGHLDIALFVFNECKNRNLVFPLESAVRGICWDGSMALFDIIINWAVEMGRPINWCKIITQGLEFGYVKNLPDICDYLKKRNENIFSALNLNLALQKACFRGYLDIVRYIIKITNEINYRIDWFKVFQASTEIEVINIDIFSRPHISKIFNKNMTIKQKQIVSFLFDEMREFYIIEFHKCMEYWDINTLTQS